MIKIEIFFIYTVHIRLYTVPDGFFLQANHLGGSRTGKAQG
jgi:hypothetical protein